MRPGNKLTICSHPKNFSLIEHAILVVMLRISFLGFLVILVAVGSLVVTEKSLAQSSPAAEGNRLDLIVEADTQVPIFYDGRALPSAGSAVRLIAIPNTSTDPSNLIYHWTVDETVLYGGSVAGRNVATFVAPRNRSVLVRVEVFNQNGQSLAKQLSEITIASPELVFYEDNPLRGLSSNAIQSPHFLIAEETTVRAEPYYMGKNIPASDLLTEWKIDRNTIDNPSGDPQEITLRNEGGTGQFRVDFHIRNLENFIQGAEAGFTIGF